MCVSRHLGHMVPLACMCTSAHRCCQRTLLKTRPTQGHHRAHVLTWAHMVATSDTIRGRYRQLLGGG